MTSVAAPQIFNIGHGGQGGEVRARFVSGGYFFSQTPDPHFRIKHRRKNEEEDDHDDVEDDDDVYDDEDKDGDEEYRTRETRGGWDTED